MMTDLFQPPVDAPQGLTPFHIGLEVLAEQACVCEPEEIALQDGFRRVLAQDLIAPHALPPFDNSAMDGYALRAIDAEQVLSAGVPIIDSVIAAGHPLLESLPEGHAARIFTGAPLPDGADCIIMQENTTRQDNILHIKAGSALKQGQHIRSAGEDIAQGQTVLRKGHKLDAAALAVCAALGCESLSVYRRLKVGVFSTGDELCSLGEALKAGATYDSNRYGVQALLTQWGADVHDLGILADDPEQIEQALKTQAADFDLIITSGGVSVGDADFVKAVLEKLGQLHFWKLAIKPGKPIALGKIGTCAFVGLPGNPVSSFVTSLLLVRPLVQALSGQTVRQPTRFKVPSGFDQSVKSTRMEWIRVALQEGQAVPYHHMGSGVMSSLIHSEGLVELPLGTYDIKQGEMLDYIPFSEFN